MILQADSTKDYFISKINKPQLCNLHESQSFNNQPSRKEAAKS